MGLVPESARPGAGPVRGRQEPSAGVGGHPTAATDGDRLCRRVHPPPWHHHAVRGARRTRRFGHHPVQAAPSPPGIPRVSQTLFDRKVPTGLDVHLIANQSTTHKHAKVKAWLASHPLYHLHYTPTYARWLKKVDRWCGLITPQQSGAVRCAVAKSWSRRSRPMSPTTTSIGGPLVWTAPADSILAKPKRLCKVINGTSH